MALVIVFLLSMFCFPFSDILAFYPPEFVPMWRSVSGFLTHMFAHGSPSHLIGNFLVGAAPMLYVNHRLGWKTTLGLFVVTGLAAISFENLIWMSFGLRPALGSSGAMFGMIGAALGLYRLDKWSRSLGLAAFILVFGWQAMQIPLSFLTNIAYAAHTGGFLSGYLLGLSINELKNHPDHPEKNSRPQSRSPRKPLPKP